MSAAYDILEEELDLVERWRVEALERAGFDHEDALELASVPEVDLHQAVSLLQRGCPPDLAFQILR
jgi:hypothetical protein